MSSRDIRKKIQYLPVIIALLAGFLFSCENSGFIPPYEGGEDGSIDVSVRSGGVVLPGEEIRLSLVYDSANGNPPDSLEIEIFSPDGESLGSEMISGTALLEDLPPVTIDDGREGLYEMHTRLFDDRNELIRENSVSFFKVAKLPVIKRIEVYPPEAVSPEASGVMIPILEGAEGSWLRWTMGSRLLGRGRYEEFRDGFIWKAPAAEGVFTLLLEVFPGLPADPDRGFDFESPVSSEVQFYVQRQNGSTPAELGPEEQFRNLLHLQGSFRDYGVMPADILVVGEPRPAVRDGVFGYHFGAGDALVLRDIGFPADGGGRGFSPFTVKMIFSAGSTGTGDSGETEDSGASAEQTGRHIFSFSDSGDRPVLTCAADPGGVPYLVFSEKGVDRLDMEGTGITGCREMSISFIPGPENVSMRWYCNGRCRGVHEVPGDIFPDMRDMKLQLGGEFGGLRGFEMLVDEFGLFFRDAENRYAADEDVFLRWMKRNLGDRAVLTADGFEKEASDAVIIGSGEVRDVLSLDPEWARAIVRVRMEGDSILPGETGLVFRGAEGAERVLPMEEFFPGGYDTESLSGGLELAFQFEREGNRSSVRKMNGDILYGTEMWKGVPVQCAVRLEEKALEMPEEETEPFQRENMQLRIKEVLVTRERSTAVAQARQVENSPENQKVAAVLNQQ